MTSRNLDFEAAIIANDLDSLALRIEMLQAHPDYTNGRDPAAPARAATVGSCLCLRRHRTDTVRCQPFRLRDFRRVRFSGNAICCSAGVNSSTSRIL